MFQKILIANRGEIACRILRTARKHSIPVVAVYSEADKDSLHVELANEAVAIGGSRPAESYLDIQKIVSAAKQTGADAIHPGYGFLSENSSLAEACEQESISFIGPHSSAIRTMASKSTAMDIAQKAGVNILPGLRTGDTNVEKLIAVADQIGFPVLLKAALGGGGRGMRIVYDRQQFHSSLQIAQSEARTSFGNDQIIMEKYLPNPRHIEVQIAGDKFGNTIHFFERDCSAQRRYQKIIEEAPAPNISSEIKESMYQAAISIAEALGYYSVGTIEFLFHGNEFYFMEMNTRLQVEHPVTELITGVDLVELQLRIAANESIEMLDIPDQPIGHAIESRIYAESPANDFLPSPGKIEYLSFPAISDNVQIHSGFRSGDVVDQNYDPLIAKIVTYRSERSLAIDEMLSALNRTHIHGVDTNVGFLWNLVDNPLFLSASIDTQLVESNIDDFVQDGSSHIDEIVAIASLLVQTQKNSNSTNEGRVEKPSSPWRMQSGWRLNSIREFKQSFEFNSQILNVSLLFINEYYLVSCGSRTMHCESFSTDKDQISVVIDNVSWSVTVVKKNDLLVLFESGKCYELRTVNYLSANVSLEDQFGSLIAPLSGRVVRVLVQPGERVTSGQRLLVIEAMKMEHQITSPMDGQVVSINFQEKDQVEEGATCLVVEPIDPDDSSA